MKTKKETSKMLKFQQRVHQFFLDSG